MNIKKLVVTLLRYLPVWQDGVTLRPLLTVLELDVDKALPLHVRVARREELFAYFGRIIRIDIDGRTDIGDRHVDVVGHLAFLDSPHLVVGLLSETSKFRYDLTLCSVDMVSR